MKHGASPRTGSSGGEPGATDWSVRGSGENMTKRPPGLEQPGRNEARRKPPDWIPGVNPVPRTGASEATGRRRQKDAPDWSNRGGMKHNISPRTGSSGGGPGATDWSVRGGRESTTKRPPGTEQPGRNEARRKPPDWIVRG